jgi:hypothetical protein
MPEKPPDSPDIEAIVNQVRAALEAGPASWMANSSTTHTTTASAGTLESLAKVAKVLEARYADLDTKVYRFDGTLAELIDHLRSAGIGLGPSYEGSHADGSPIRWMMSNPSTLEVWRLHGSFWIGTPKALGRLAKGPDLSGGGGPEFDSSPDRV